MKDQKDKIIMQWEYFDKITKSGKGTFTFPDASIYTGEVKNAKFSGEGTYNYSNGDKYVGQWLDDQRNGFGTHNFSNGDKYVGNWKDGIKHGLGTYYYSNSDIYVGEFYEDAITGYGTMTYEDGSKYIGDFINEEYCGIGIMDNGNGTKYIGEFKNDKQHGAGIIISDTGTKYMGQFNKDEFDGAGIIIDGNGLRYIGEYKNGKMNGAGIVTLQSGDKYIGNSINSKYNGQGILEKASGEKYIGEFKDGKYHGYGYLVNKDVDYRGNFKDGLFFGEGALFWIGVFYEGKFNGNEFKGKYEHKYNGRDVVGRFDWDREDFIENEIPKNILNQKKVIIAPKDFSQIYYLFFDTETTGLPKNYKAPISDINNWPRLVQLALLGFDKYGNKILEVDYIIKPLDFTIPSESSKIHGITNNIALSKGLPLNSVLNVFAEIIENSKFIIAHNILYDESIIGCEFYRSKIDNILNSKKKICTMESSVNFCAISGAYGYKWPKLSELHYKLFGTEFREAHNALVDVNATARCFWELKKQGII